MSDINFKMKADKLYDEMGTKFGVCGTKALKLVTDFATEALKSLSNANYNINSPLMKFGPMITEKNQFIQHMSGTIEKAKADCELCIEQGNAEDSCYESQINQFEVIAPQVDSLCDFINSIV